MKRTISVMVGKGSVNHNTWKFHASNTDPERTYLNRSYCNDDIKTVYRELFDESVERYNAKQTRNDRMIENYYKKICSGKQEKSFHEIILQIGNCDDMNAQSDNGERAAKILDEYMQTFQERNPNLRVFSAHLHMDEATPHLHINFVPFTIGSNRGLDTRVSLKQALVTQGFKGGSRSETEWNQWVSSEKQHLANVMSRHDIEWEQKGTHEKHLSVLDYEKKMRSEEVAQLESKIDDLSVIIEDTQKSADKVQNRLKKLEKRESTLNLNINKYDYDPEWQLLEPTTLMSAKSYKTKFVDSLISKLKDVIRSLAAQCLRLISNVRTLEKKFASAKSEVERLTDRVTHLKTENTKLNKTVNEYKVVSKSIGDDEVRRILVQAENEEKIKKQLSHSRNVHTR